MARPFVELYINEQKVYFKEPPEIFVTYAHTDLHNPTVVKNSYTKTITVEGTPENNRIFNNFYDLKRINNNELFNPSRKETFTLYRNGEPMETGYVKLDKVNKKNGRITYDITLYGGLGQFLYNLQYKEDGEQMKLSDLEYNTDFNFTVDRNTVKGAWQHITGMKDVDSKYDIINFAPCYNGIPKDFAADKVAIDVESFKSDDALYESFLKSKDGYTTVDGWVIGELKKEYDEWQVGDLRSYLQRPVIRFKEVFQACCNPKNNGGYKVDLDVDFFNTENQYYENAWMTLPLLSEMEGIEKSSPILKIESNTLVLDVENGTNIKKLTVPMFMQAKADAGGAFRLYTGVQITLNPSKDTWVESYNTCKYAQLVVFDKNGNIVNGSNVNVFYTNITNAVDFKIEPIYEAPINRIIGDYVNAPNTNLYIFNAEFYDFNIYNLKWEEGYYMQVILKSAEIKNYEIGWYRPDYPENEKMHNNLGIDFLYKRNEYHKWEETVKTVESDVPVVAENVMIDEKLPYSSITRKVNKNSLLNSENTPCDYFLSYLKMFNLHIWKDMYEDLIYVRQRKNFFEYTVKDIEDWVDRGDDITIKPLTFENKWLNFNFETIEDSVLAKDYLDEFGIKYGCQKIDTNYNFDNSSKDLFKESVFKNAIQCRGKSKYYISLRCVEPNDAYDVKSFYLDGFQTYLFDGNGDTTEGTKFSPKTIEIMRDWWKQKYYDFMPKPSFVNKDNEGVEGANVLLFYNGRQLMKDNEDKLLNIQITDDIPQFEKLNDGEPCWIWTADWQKATDTSIGGAPFYGDGYLPCFSRYITNENGWVTHSWDFGTPKYLYVPDYSIDDSSNLYTRYWKPYIRDQYNVDTKVVECKVLLKERVIGDWLQRFYYWDGRYWILNKITDYNPSSNGTTKCEFVSVNNINNYLS